MNDAAAPTRFSVSDRAAVLWVVVLTLALAGITASRTFTHPLWGDEFRTWRDGIEKPLGLVLTWHHNPDHAPLGHLLARAGAALFGVQHAWALRLGSWLCGLACVAALWWMGRTLWSNLAGLLVALMFVVDSNIPFQMTQARMYAPLMLATIVAIGFAGSIIVRPDRPWPRVIGLGLAIGVGIWSHATIFAVVLALIVVGVGCLFVRERRRVGVALLVGVAIGLLVGVQGVIKIVGRHDAEAVVAFDVTDSPAGQFTQAVTQLAGKSGFAALNLVVAAIGVWAIWRLRPTHRPVALLFALVTVLTIVNLAIAVHYRPIGHSRYLTVLQPPVWLAMAVLIVELFRVPSHGRTLGIVGVAIFVVFAVMGFRRALDNLRPDAQARFFEQAASFVRAHQQPGDRYAVIAHAPYGMFSRYYGLAVDDTIDDALTFNASKRQTRDALRAADLDRGVIWLVCVIPSTKAPRYRSVLDDPDAAFDLIANERGITATTHPDLSRAARWQTAVLRFDANGASEMARFRDER